MAFKSEAKLLCPAHALYQLLPISTLAGPQTVPWLFYFGVPFEGHPFSSLLSQKTNTHSASIASSGESSLSLQGRISLRSPLQVTLGPCTHPDGLSPVSQLFASSLLLQEMELLGGECLVFVSVPWRFREQGMEESKGIKVEDKSSRIKGKRVKEAGGRVDD